MVTIDPVKEFNRLSEIYSRMADEQLVLVARDFPDLTDTAQQALRAEFQKRHLELPASESKPEPAISKEPPAPEPSDDEEQQTEQFVDYRQLVEVRRFRDLLDAEVAKGALDSAGIECFLGDDNMVRMDWFYSNAIGGVKLMVRPEEFEAAQHVLDQPIPEHIEFEDGETYEQPKCPKCGSLDISYQNLDQMTAFGSAAIGIPLPYTLDRWECLACGNTWKDEAETAKGESKEPEK